MALYKNSFYPFFGLSSLRGQRGQRWADLVDWISTLPGSDPHTMAFTMTIRRLNRMRSMESKLCSDPFCAICAAQVVALFDGSEQELLDFYYNNLQEVQYAIRNMRVREVVRRREVVAA
ncbi:MAG: hypothetical protein JXB30_12925 [Anaerolineae bacterium]|nr:hypothetical protein [Anaerolineae bacterium]